MARHGSPLEGLLAGGGVHGILSLLLVALMGPGSAFAACVGAAALGALVAVHSVPLFRARRGIVVGVLTTALGIVLASFGAIAWGASTHQPASTSLAAIMEQQPFALIAAVLVAALVGTTRARRVSEERDVAL